MANKTQTKQKKPVVQKRKTTASSKRVAPKTVVRKQTKKLLVPHKDNDFRPHLVRPWGIVAVLVVALVAQISYSYVTTGRIEILGRVSHVKTEELVAETNKQRVAEGLSELQQNETLSQAARLKADDMLAHNYWAHVSPTGVEPWKWLGDVAYNYEVAGENLAKNYATSQATVDAWMNSASHRANILNDTYTDVGFAVVEGVLEGRETSLVVAFYGKQASAPVVAGADVTPKLEYSAPISGGGGLPMSNFASIFRAMSPVTIISLGGLALVALVGAAAHHYRHQLPKSWQRNWKKHHGAYTFFGMIALGMLVIFVTAMGGGSI